MAKVLLKGLKEYFDAPDDEARIAASLKNDPAKWKESVKLGNHPCVMVCEIKDISIDDERVIQNDADDNLKKYYADRQDFIQASLEDKVNWSLGQFKFFWVIVSRTNLNTHPDKLKLIEWYKSLAREWFAANPTRTMISLKFLSQEYLKTYTVEEESHGKEEEMRIKSSIRSWALRTWELAEIQDKFA